MGKKEIPIENLQNIKVVRGILAVAFVALLSGWVLLVWNETRVRDLDIDGIELAQPEDGYRKYVDSIKCANDNSPITEDYITVYGWVIKSGEDAKDVAIKIVFRNMCTDQYYVVPTTIITRKDVTTHYDDGCSYDNSGFSVKIRQGGKIDVSRYDYEVYALHTLNGVAKLVPLKTTLNTWGDK